MHTKKYYQYKYLLEKIRHRYTNDEYDFLNTEYWDNMGTGLSSESLELSEIHQAKQSNRTTHLNNWLYKINNKYKYQ
jgi:hypothetical protein